MWEDDLVGKRIVAVSVDAKQNLLAIGVETDTGIPLWIKPEMAMVQVHLMASMT